MAETHETIVIVERERIDRERLGRLVSAWFGDMVKLVVDVRRRVVAVGGELHADAEHLLLERGSHQADLWGANYYPGLGPQDFLEFTALINIRPAQANPSMELLDPEIREQVRELVHELVGRGEAV